MVTRNNTLYFMKALIRKQSNPLPTPIDLFQILQFYKSMQSSRVPVANFPFLSKAEWKKTKESYGENRNKLLITFELLIKRCFPYACWTLLLLSTLAEIKRYLWPSSVQWRVNIFRQQGFLFVAAHSLTFVRSDGSDPRGINYRVFSGIRSTPRSFRHVNQFHFFPLRRQSVIIFEFCYWFYKYLRPLRAQIDIGTQKRVYNLHSGNYYSIKASDRNRSWRYANVTCSQRFVL